MADQTNLKLAPNPMSSVDRSMVAQLGGLIVGTFYALGAALVLGLLWYGMEVFLHFRFWLLTAVFGLAIGYSIGTKSKAAPFVSAIVSLVVTVSCLAVLLYFVDRHAFEAVGKWPLWTGWKTAKSMIDAGFSADKVRYVFVGIAIAFGGVSGWVSARDARSVGSPPRPPSPRFEAALAFAQKRGGKIFK